MLQPATQKQRRRAALERQMARLGARLTVLARRSDQFSTIRLVYALAGFAAIIASTFIGGPRLFVITAIGFIAIFAVIILAHQQVKRAIQRTVTWRDIKALHVARMGLDWDKLPPALNVQPIPGHPFEIDLDMTGSRSIHHLIDMATSREGGERLRDWLLQTAPDAEQSRDRAKQVETLVGMSRFRDRLTLNARLAADGSDKRWEASRLMHWLDQAHSGQLSELRSSLMLLIPLAAIHLLALALIAAGILPTGFAVISFLYFALLFNRMNQTGDLLETALALEDVLLRLRSVLGWLERYRYPSALQPLAKAFTEPTNRPTRYLRQIGRLVGAAGVHINPVLAILVHTLMPWDVMVAYGLARYKITLAAKVPGWLDAWYEFEALSSLATFAYLNPEYSFPEIKAPSESQKAEPIFAAHAIGHPLLHDDRKVCNDFEMDKRGRTIIITGSNMAGKSSFLRTLGVNLSLAYAGGPVNALSLSTITFRLFTCIRVTDSVTDGFSYFYAEVKRLKALLNALETPHPDPLFFLIDEIFRGTNNRERLIGSRAYITALVGRNGLGVISTHDLELIKLADEMPDIANFHFREEVRDGLMAFDYTLRPGPCPTTNALRIMALEGLPVSTPA